MKKYDSRPGGKQFDDVTRKLAPTSGRKAFVTTGEKGGGTLVFDNDVVAHREIRIPAPFERVELDALRLPLFIKTPYGESNDVYVVHAIDCSTSVVLGWCLVIGAPRVSHTLKCIETILFPKASRFEALGLKYDFDIFGTPSMLVVDSSPGNKSDRLLGLSSLSISVNRQKHPHRMPLIERLNRSLNEALETLPGSTRLHLKDGERDPLALGDTVMTIEEVERCIVRYYFEIWATKPLERLKGCTFDDNDDLGSTPLQRYRTLTERRGSPRPPPPSLDAWRSAIYESQFRTLSRNTGISYANFHFKGDGLPHLFDQFGEKEVRVLVDPDDFRWLYVVDRDGRTLVPLVNSSTSETTPAYSFDEAALLPKEAAMFNVNLTVDVQRRDALNRLFESSSKDRKGQAGGRPAGKAAAQSKEIANSARRQEAVERSENKPLRLRVLALDLEQTLISTAVSQFPRPGLFHFLERCKALFERIVIFTAVSEDRVKQITETLANEGTAPVWFRHLECVRWEGATKDLAFIPGCDVGDAVLVDDLATYVHPCQLAQWVRIKPFEPPYDEADTGLAEVLEELAQRVRISHHRGPRA